jgi:predicted DNA-binding transcriptional regulator YafY
MTTGLVRKEFLTIPELAQRWSVSSRTVRRRLMALRAKVLDFNPRGGRCRKLVPFGAILELESRQLRVL